MNGLARNLVLRHLNRPEYVPYPEGLLSDMYWSIFEVAGWEAGDGVGTKVRGLIYDADGQDGGRNWTLESTRPSADVSRWKDGLRRSSLAVVDNGDSIAEAIASSLLGIRSKKARRRPATPLSPNIGLLQNRVGIMAKSRPQNLSEIIEEMYRLGAASSLGSGTETDSAGGRLGRAAARRLDNDDFLRTIDEAVRLGIFPQEIVNRRTVGDEVTVTHRENCLPPDNPFVWFHRNWSRLTSDEWVDALPARRWADWATAVLRTAIGFGFLWEMHWYETIGRHILGVGPTGAADQSLATIWGSTRSRPVMDWEPSSSSVERRDVSSSMKALVEKGVAVRLVLDEMIEKDSEETIDEAVRRLAGDAKARQQLEGALQREVGATGSAKNFWEAVRYSLGIREESGSFADYYGVLRRRGRRYLLIDPETEWVAVIASLTCGIPSNRSTLREVQNELSCLGLQPSVSELVLQLERAGLARSSPDADDAVYVEAAYGG